MIATLSELRKKSFDYIDQRISEGYKIGGNLYEKSCNHQFYHLYLERSKDELWDEWISFGINKEGDYEFRATYSLNGVKQNTIHWKYYNSYSTAFSNDKKEALDYSMWHFSVYAP